MNEDHEVREQKEVLCKKLREIQLEFGRIIHPRNIMIITSNASLKKASNIQCLYCPTCGEDSLVFNGV